jgi:hypothetical protein
MFDWSALVTMDVTSCLYLGSSFQLDFYFKNLEIRIFSFNILIFTAEEIRTFLQIATFPLKSATIRVLFVNRIMLTVEISGRTTHFD